MAWLYRDLAAWLWWNVSVSSVESHCAAVPLMAACLWWMRRETVLAEPAETSALGLVVAIWACVLGLLATAADSLVASGVSLLFLVHGSVLALWGPARTRASLASLYFLVFMLPLRYPVEVLMGFPMRLVSTRLAAGLLEVAGLRAKASGTLLELPGFSVQIGSPCSGLNVLTALLMVSAFYSVALRLGGVAFWTVVASAVPAALLANTARIALVAGAGSRLNAETALGVFHDYSGLVTFGAAALALGLFARLASRLQGAPGPAKERRRAREASGPAASRQLIGLVLILALAATVDGILAKSRTFGSSPSLSGFPREVAGARSVDEPLTAAEVDLEASTGGEILRRAFDTRRGAVWLALVSSRASWRAHHPPEFCYMAQGWTVLENRARSDAGGSYRELVVEKGGERRVVRYWFTDGVRSMESLLGRWFAALETGFRGRARHPWLMVSLSAPESNSDLLDEMRPQVEAAAKTWLNEGSASLSR